MINKEILEEILGCPVEVITSFELSKVEGKIPLIKEMRLKKYYQLQFGYDVDIVMVREVGNNLIYAVYRETHSDLEYPVILH